MARYLPEVVGLDGTVAEDELVVHDETRPSAYAFLLSRMVPPEFPTPIGIFRAVVDGAYEDGVNAQIAAAREKSGEGQLAKLLNSGETWEVS
jgi:2-oxoglutarate ferredoxin oxidoreductase subunit beta